MYAMFRSVAFVCARARARAGRRGLDRKLARTRMQRVTRRTPDEGAMGMTVLREHANAKTPARPPARTPPRPTPAQSLTFARAHTPVPSPLPSPSLSLSAGLP